MPKIPNLCFLGGHRLCASANAWQTPMGRHTHFTYSGLTIFRRVAQEVLATCRIPEVGIEKRFIARSCIAPITTGVKAAKSHSAQQYKKFFGGRAVTFSLSSHRLIASTY